MQYPQTDLLGLSDTFSGNKGMKGNCISMQMSLLGLSISPVYPVCKLRLFDIIYIYFYFKIKVFFSIRLEMKSTVM